MINYGLTKVSMGHHKKVINFCERISSDKFVVQGSGGNVSWKDGPLMWIKASGACLSDAGKKEIFVPLIMAELERDMSKGIFIFTSQLAKNQFLRPSIETALHALMPQKFVAHLHLVDALVHLVTEDGATKLMETLHGLKINLLRAESVDYFRPGEELARAVQGVISRMPETNILLLKNHGVVIGANSLDILCLLLDKLRFVCNLSNNKHKHPIAKENPKVDPRLLEIYKPLVDLEVNSLVFDPTLYNRLSINWVLYPDHAVFLGPKAFFYSSWDECYFHITKIPKAPNLVFIKNIGVFITSEFTFAMYEQLKCYYEVISRVHSTSKLNALSHQEISGLLDWESEKYRQQNNSLT